jgi:hypothetical protein
MPRSGRDEVCPPELTAAATAICRETRCPTLIEFDRVTKRLKTDRASLLRNNIERTLGKAECRRSRPPPDYGRYRLPPLEHRWQEYDGAHGRWICANCAMVTSAPALADARWDCVDDC